jgi:hypothetical protein
MVEIVAYYSQSSCFVSTLFKESQGNTMTLCGHPFTCNNDIFLVISVNGFSSLLRWCWENCPAIYKHAINGFVRGFENTCEKLVV